MEMEIYFELDDNENVKCQDFWDAEEFIGLNTYIWKD